MDQRVKLVIGGILTALVVTLVIQNSVPVRTELFFWSVDLPGAALLLGALLVGIVLGLLLARSRKKKKQKGGEKEKEAKA